jgi:hypothetical protein
MAKGRDQHERRRHSAPPSEPEHVNDKAARRGVEMARVMANPVRFQILIDMNTPTRRFSAKQWAEEQPELPNNAGYHFRVLEKAGCIRLYKTVKRRGAEERIYEPVKRAMAWHEEWEHLGPVIRQLVAASAFGPLVQKVGNSIDGGTFDARPESHLSWDTQYVDQEGWETLAVMFQRHLEEVMAECKKIKERLKANPDLERFLVTYMMATFETAREFENDADQEDRKGAD